MCGERGLMVTCPLASQSPAQRGALTHVASVARTRLPLPSHPTAQAIPAPKVNMAASIGFQGLSVNVDAFPADISRAVEVHAKGQALALGLSLGALRLYKIR
jgi:hypothetical protein